MNANQKYAQRLGKEYGVEVDLTAFTDQKMTVFDIAKLVLPSNVLRQWLLDEKEHMQELRYDLNMMPYGLHDKVFDDELAKLDK